jgi:cytochrome P450
MAQVLRYSRDPFGFLVGLQRRYGDIFTVRFPSGPLVFLAEPTLVKELFTGDPATFRAGEANARVLMPAFGPNSVQTLDGPGHRRQRKLLLPQFHGESIRRYGEQIGEIAAGDIETWPLGEPFALLAHARRVSLAVILRVVFGWGEGYRLDRASKLVTEFIRRLNMHTQIPGIRRDLGRFSPESRSRRARAELDEFLHEEIAMRGAGPEGSERDDLLAVLLRAAPDDGGPIIDQRLRDGLITVLGVGHQTTATAVAWAVERLLRSPRVLARLRESMRSGEEAYLDATIKETLRARPPIVEAARMLSTGATIGGYELPAGIAVHAAIPALHYRPDLYPEPHEFRPERFLTGTTDSYAWIPFGGGIRRCLGAAFVQQQIGVHLRTILERTELRAADRRPERLRPRKFVLAPSDGARVVLERRLQPVR